MNKTESPGRTRIPRTRGAGAGRKSAPTVATATAKLSPARSASPQHCANSEAHVVTFDYFDPDAREVLVAGSFNGWQPQATPMSRQRAGKWSTAVLLPPGQYEYRFVVDGHWRDDPMATRFVTNSYGGLNCVIEVKPRTVQAAPRP